MDLKNRKTLSRVKIVAVVKRIREELSSLKQLRTNVVLTILLLNVSNILAIIECIIAYATMIVILLIN